ncbi:hypothetical protein, partial [Marinobacter sp. DUT-1]|uniref:hypothetical protein n=1 Tax=Marinobacter sp. DUT-1 TaxID=3412037 RepID=UPI003D164224
RNLETIFFKTFKQLLPRAAAASVACPSEVVRILQPSGKLSTTNLKKIQIRHSPGCSATKSITQ